MTSYTPLLGRMQVAAPDSFTRGTTVLVVTRDEEHYFIEAVTATGEDLKHQREVFKARTSKEIRAWFAGNSWNCGGPLSRPVWWINKR